MMAFPKAHESNRDLITSISLKDFDVSWAGLGPRGDQFCFGSENGRILFTDFDGIPTTPAQIALRSEEAINGIAFIKHWMSISSRSEMVMLTLPTRPEEPLLAAHIPQGAHDVIAADGIFFAPAGQKGLVFYKPQDGEKQEITITKERNGELYFYRAIVLGDNSGKRVVACASRRDGIVSFDFQDGNQFHPLNTLTFNGLDVIDIAPLELGLGAVALGKDGTIILFADISRDRSPTTVKYEAINGTAYRIITAGAFVFVLTSEGLYVIEGLHDPLKRRGDGIQETPMLILPINAADIFAAGSRWILIATLDGVLRFDLSLLHELSKQRKSGGKIIAYGEMAAQIPVAIKPGWIPGMKPQEQFPMAAA